MAPKRKIKRNASPRVVGIDRARRRSALEVAKLFAPGQRVALTTHVNADGDGTGSEVALWHLLTALGARPVIANPTPFPSRFGFLLASCQGADKSPEAVKHLQRADAIVVLDISDAGRLGHLGSVVQNAGVPVACIDHHVSGGTLPAGPRLVDPSACATGELIYDLAQSSGWQLSREAAQALYVALMTDTGGFRFSNTTARTLQVAASLLTHGFHPEEIYQHVYADEPEGKMRLISEVLETLVVEDEHGLAWVTVPPGALKRHGLDAADLDGVVELPRSIRGVRLALLFRQLANGRVKVSFRSIGDIDVASLAEQFGGGGHRKAAGASLVGDLNEVQERVLVSARAATAIRSVARFSPPS